MSDFIEFIKADGTIEMVHRNAEALEQYAREVTANIVPNADLEANIEEVLRTEYKRQRAIEYPDIKEFADAMYWSSKGDNTKLDAYYAACQAIKDKYPKV